MPSNGFDAATRNLNLTPGEQYLYQHHLSNLYGSGKVTQPNGDVSTVLQAVVNGPNGQFYNIPTVWGGQQLQPNEAAKRAAAVGWDKWPSYSTPDEADDRYINQMHPYMDADVGNWLRSQGAAPQ